MHVGRRAPTVVAALLVWLLAASAAVAGPLSYEFWPEIDTWLRLSSAWRLSLFIPVSENLDTHYREGNLIAQADCEFGKPRLHRRLMDEDRARSMGLLLARGGYFGGKSLADQGDEYTEYTAFGELHQRIPVKGGLMLSHRLRSELRWLGKDSHEFSTRWRYRLMAEREFGAGRVSFVPYVNVEPYYDSRYDTVNRTRLTAGSSMAWSRHTALEVNATYQYDSHSSTKEILALGVILHVFFDASHTRSSALE
jgi:hypothetical protein